MQNSIWFSSNTDPFYNLALEEALFETQREGCTLYLWQNQNTVVIGKNQNAWKECRISLLEQENGRLARRSSGGGAVFHDLGNLNFTFIMPRTCYDLHKQLSVIQKAAAAFSIKTEFTGRNDLVESVSGHKFSGNAFRFTNQTAMHHGTILVDVDMDKLTRYLSPPQEKLQSKGVDSVRSRVMNLASLNEVLTIKRMRDAVVDAFISIYGPARLGQETDVNNETLQSLAEKYSSWEWRMGRTPKFDISMENRFEWGLLEMQLSLRNGLVQEAEVYSDAMDEAVIESISPALLQCAFNSKALATRLRDMGQTYTDSIAEWLEEKGF